MEHLIDLSPWLAAMAILIACSSFFSASETALFCLRWRDRRAFASGNSAQQITERLLADPDHLLTAILFWNLVINITYFAIASRIITLLIGQVGIGSPVVLWFSFGTLLALIFAGEMLPKSLAVLRAPALAAFLGVPLSVAVRILDPIMPTLRTVNILSCRLIWPNFRAEPYMEVADLERAIELSTSDAQLIAQEKTVLRNLVSLSEIRADEWMRPRRQFRVFRPPVSLDDLDGDMTPSGYLFVTEHDSDEIVAAIHLREVTELHTDHLEHHAVPVEYAPWCATVADTWQRLQEKQREVAVIVNEHGETIGVLTLNDILDTVFTERPGRSERLLNRDPIQLIDKGTWHVTGLTNLRRLAQYFNVQLPACRSVTVEGILQETLGVLPSVGDECQWGPFLFRVVNVPSDGQMDVHLRMRYSEE